MGQLGKIFLARIEPGGDLLNEIRSVVKDVGIETGLIMDCTGSLTKARLQKFQTIGKPEETSVGIIEVEGPLEASGHGIIGLTRGSGGLGGYVDGEPYIHMHLTVTSAEETLCGHLMEGTIIRSLHPISHFTVVIASIDHARLTLVVNKKNDIRNAEGKFIAGGVYHELTEI
jgi:predicted DNA-binding protein with PD1-like motif